MGRGALRGEQAPTLASLTHRWSFASGPQNRYSQAAAWAHLAISHATSRHWGARPGRAGRAGPVSRDFLAFHLESPSCRRAPVSVPVQSGDPLSPQSGVTRAQFGTMATRELQRAWAARRPGTCSRARSSSRLGPLVWSLEPGLREQVPFVWPSRAIFRVGPLLRESAGAPPA